jgi:hypothetical protein
MVLQKNICKFLILISFWMIFPGNLVFSQKYDSTFYPADSNAILHFTNKLDIYSPLLLSPLDTTLFDFEAYDPLLKKMPFVASLGNVGLAYKNPEFNILNNTGFDYGCHAFDAYFSHPDDVLYYVNPKPYTEVGYVTGAKKEQLLSVKHDQRVLKRLTFGLDFDLISSLGTYQQQKSNNYNLALKTNYFTEDLRYGILLNYTNGRINVEENGGILYDSIYEQDIEPSRSIIPIKLTNAGNRLRSSGVYLQQYFQLSKKSKSVRVDSTENERRKIKFKFGRISHSFNYKRNSLAYSDLAVDTLNYPVIYQDSLITYDSVFFQHVENTFSWSNADYLNRINPQPFLILLGIKHQLAEVQDTLTKTTFSHLAPYGSIEISPAPFLDLKGSGSYVLNGDEYQGDFDLSAIGTLQIMRNKPYKTTLNFEMNFDNHAASYFYQHYFSNHFRWDNGFNKVKTNGIAAFIAMNRFKAGFDIFKIKDYLYFGTDTLPKQYNQSLEVWKIYLNKQFKLGKFDVDGRFIYQKASKPDIIRLPELMAYFTFTFNWKLFNGALHTRTGFDVYYYSKYYADSYIPAIRSFYLQNQKEIGDFMHIDAFLNFNVKRTRFFMKFQNVLSGFGQRNFYTVPHYPLQDMAFKFGLSWRFHD